MNAHTRKTYEAITGGRAPRDLEWTQFVSFWQEVADDVEPESGDRLAVHLNGHREVFRRQHDGRVSLEDIENARRLLAEAPPKEDTGRLVVVAIDSEQARLITFELGDGPTTESQARTIRDAEPDGRHLRTVERRRGRDDVHELSTFFDEVAAALTGPDPVVVLGAGHGKSDDAEAFAERVRAHHAELWSRVRGIGGVDLSAATDTDLRDAAERVLRGD